MLLLALDSESGCWDLPCGLSPLCAGRHRPKWMCPRDASLLLAVLAGSPSPFANQ